MAQNASKLLYNTLYSRGSLCHGPVLLYSYTQLYIQRALIQLCAPALYSIHTYTGLQPRYTR